MRSTKTLALLAALTLCAGLLTACGEKKTEETQATVAPQTTQSAAVTTQPANTQAAATTAPEPAETESAVPETKSQMTFPEGETPIFTLPAHTEENGGSEAETKPTQPTQPQPTQPQPTQPQPTQPTQPSNPTSPSQGYPASGEDIPIADSNENLPANP